MLQVAVGLLLIALVAGLFGFGFIASSFMAVAKIVFFVFIGLAVLSFLFGGPMMRRWRA